MAETKAAIRLEELIRIYDKSIWLENSREVGNRLFFDAICRVSEESQVRIKFEVNKTLINNMNALKTAYAINEEVRKTLERKIDEL